MNIGAKIKSRRKQLQLTQAQLAEKVSKSPQVISNWERGYTPSLSPEHLKGLCTALQCTADYLLASGSELVQTKQDFSKQAGRNDQNGAAHAKPLLTSKPFDKELLADLLKQALGSRSIIEFLTPDMGINPVYFSQIIRCERNTAPRPQVLEAIAAKAGGTITYEKLMVAAGYWSPGDYCWASAPAGDNQADISLHELELIKVIRSLSESDRKDVESFIAFKRHHSNHS